PGPIGRRTSVGTNRLLRDGATMVLEVRDVLDAVGLGALARAAGGAGADGDEPDAAREPPVGLTPAASRVWRALGPEPVHADELADSFGVGAGALLRPLPKLELAGPVRQAAGWRCRARCSSWSWRATCGRRRVGATREPEHRARRSSGPDTDLLASCFLRERQWPGGQPRVCKGVPFLVEGATGGAPRAEPVAAR